MDKLLVFKKELGYIKDKDIRIFTEQAILKLPDYFFTVSSSSTGKYHSKFSLGEGGLVRHTRANVTIAMDLMQLEMMGYSELDKDIVISSLILHDGLKHGVNGGKYSVAEHPLLMADMITSDNELNKLINKNVLELIADCISVHMGQWNTDYKTKKEILPKPKGKLQNFVHLCDYLGSRKYFEEFNFDVDVIRN